MRRRRGRAPGTNVSAGQAAIRAERQAKVIEEAMAEREQQARLPLPPGPRNGHSYTDEDDAQHTEEILALRLRRATTTAIVRTMRDRHGIGGERTTRLLKEGLRRLVGDFEEHRGSARAETVARLRMDLVAIRDRAQDTSLTVLQREKYWRLVQKHESLLAEVEGTLAPIEVEVNLKAVHVSYVSELTDEQRQQLLARARENARLAQLARGTIDAEGEAAE